MDHFFDTFFLFGHPQASVEKGSYVLPLVFMSYFVASFASYTALAMAQQLVAAKTAAEKRFFRWGGAFAMGAGIWAMHFTGMLSYKMRMLVSYDVPLTVVSIVIAIVVSYAALGIASDRDLPLGRLLVSAVLLGLGICGMHYTGMAAMKMDGALRYIPDVFALSVGIAIAASAAALWVAFTLAKHKSEHHQLFQIGAAFIMGAAICGMHYTGMAATVFMPYANCRFDPYQNFDFLAMIVVGMTSIILSIALIWGSQEPGSGV